MPKFTLFRDVGLWREVAEAVWRAPNDPSVYGAIEVDFTNGLSLGPKSSRARSWIWRSPSTTATWTA